MANKINTKREATELPVLYQTLVVKSARVEASSIDAWQQAVNSAKRGERAKLYDLYENILADGILSDALGKRINAITNAELAFIRDGKNVEAVDDLIDSIEFEELLREIILSKAWGKSVIEVMFSPKFDIFSYPRRNIRITNLDKPLAEHRKFIAAKDADREGYDFTVDNRFIDCGKDDDLGFLFKAAPYVIYKRGGFGDWAQFVEIFGMPFMIGKYNSYDTKARDLLFEALEKIGSNPKAAIPTETDIEIRENKSNGSSGLYSMFKSACNEEILIAVLGNTMTTVQGDKGARALGEVHQQTEEKVNAADRRFVARILNRHLLPMLIERGFDAAGGYFVFPDSGENITTQERVDLALRIRKEGIPVDDDYIYNISGIPKPESAKANGTKKETSKTETENNRLTDDDNVSTSSRRGNSDEVTDAPDDDNVSTSSCRGNSDEVTDAPDDDNVSTSSCRCNSDSTDPERSFFQKLFRFFVQAPASVTGAIQNFTAKYAGITTPTFADSGIKITIDVAALFSQAIQNIYNNANGKQPVVEKRLFDITNTVLQQGIEQTFEISGAEFGQRNEAFINQFKYNAAVFSAFKNHRQTKEIVDLLTDSEGNLRSFHQFRQLANNVSKDYNQTWLQTEYNTAVRAARSAANWLNFQKAKHLYPNLQYMLSTASSKSRRPIHEAWVGTVLPIDHPWWDTHMPPSDWNCKCSVEQTDRPETAVPQVDDDSNKTFRNNPGKTAEFVRLKEHPYIKKECPFVGNCDRLNLKKAEHPYKPQCEICLFAKKQFRIAENKKLYEKLLKDSNYVDVKFDPDNGGLMAEHKSHFKGDRNKMKKHFGNLIYYDLEKECQEILYKNGHSCILEPDQKQINKVFVSALDTITDWKKMDIRSCTKNVISYRNMLDEKNRQLEKFNKLPNIQKSNSVILYFHDSSLYDKQKVLDGISALSKILKNRNDANHIKEIICVVSDGRVEVFK